jgi:hypothetical protein
MSFLTLFLKLLGLQGTFPCKPVRINQIEIQFLYKEMSQMETRAVFYQPTWCRKGHSSCVICVHIPHCCLCVPSSVSLMPIVLLKKETHCCMHSQSCTTSFTSSLDHKVCCGRPVAWYRSYGATTQSHLGHKLPGPLCTAFSSARQPQRRSTSSDMRALLVARSRNGQEMVSKFCLKIQLPR